MAMLPDFTPQQRKRLVDLKLRPEQIAELRYALLVVRMVLTKPAANNDVSEHLREVEKLASDLIRKLSAIGIQKSPEHSAAYALLEVNYWQGEMLDEVGATIPEHLLPRLAALKKAAVEARTTLPNKPARWRKADPRPIKRIRDALYAGWAKAQRGRATRIPEGLSLEEALAAAKENRTLPFPKAFDVSKSPNSVFRDIAGICYEAAGGGPDSDPERAIKAFLQEDREQTARAMAALEKGIARATR